MIGIYALTWENCDRFYIGQSQNVESRFKEHISSLKRNAVTYNSKLQDMYNSKGTPTLVLVEKCSLIDLDACEIFWIKEFDSINNGLNVSAGGECITRGTIGPSSLYSKTRILRAFSMLYKGLDTLHIIATKSKVSIGALGHINNGSSHLWLKEEYPSQYLAMNNNAKLRLKQNQTGNNYNLVRNYPLLKGPDGNIHSIKNVLEFCRKEGLNTSSVSNLYAVLLGKRATHKGYSLANPNTTTTTNTNNYSILDPDNILFSNISNISAFCREHPLLLDNFRVSSRGISSLLRGERNTYKGFSRPM